MSTGHTITSRTLMARHLFIHSRALLAASAARSRGGIVLPSVPQHHQGLFCTDTAQPGRSQALQLQGVSHAREVQALPLVRPASVQLLTGRPPHLPGFPSMASLGHRDGPNKCSAITRCCGSGCTGHRGVPCAAHIAPVCPSGLQVGCEPFLTALSA